MKAIKEGWFSLHSPSSIGFGRFVRSWWNLPRCIVNISKPYHTISPCHFHRYQPIQHCLVVSSPPKNISQLGWLSSIYWKIQVMFQTINQKLFNIIKPCMKPSPPSIPPFLHVQVVKDQHRTGARLFSRAHRLRPVVHLASFAAWRVKRVSGRLRKRGKSRGKLWKHGRNHGNMSGNCKKLLKNLGPNRSKHAGANGAQM